MSETPHNDIERDAGLMALYRAAAQDVPPAALDDAIRAAARRAVGARPRPAGFSFSRAWRMPLSIAAVMVLSVSIVTLMREEVPELTAPPRADAKLESRLGTDDNAVPADAGFVRDEQKPKNIGLKPPQPASSSGLGMRAPEYLDQAARSKKDAVAERLDADTTAPAALAKRRDAPAGEADSRGNKVAASTERQRESAMAEPPREIAQATAASPPRKEAAKPAQVIEPAAGSLISGPAAGAVAGAPAENKTRVGQAAATADRVEPALRGRVQAHDAPARQSIEAPPAPVAATKAAAPIPPQAKPMSPPAVSMSKLESVVDLPPGKWLERIEELRKQGKVEEAKASLAEFRKRYPDYRLPDSLRDWAKP